MEKKSQKSHILFLVLLGIVTYLAALVIWPYLGFLILAVVIAYTAHPLYERIERKIRRPTLSATIMLILVGIVILLPSFFLVSSLISQGTQVVASMDVSSAEQAQVFLEDHLGIEVDLTQSLTATLGKMRDFLIKESFQIFGRLAEIGIGLAIMFFALFYLFRDGEKLYGTLTDLIPLQRQHKHVLFGEMQLVTNAVIYGQILTSVLQGIVGGIGFAIFGIDNPVFWGFAMAILAFLPIVGTPFIFIPAGIIQIVGKHYVAGIGIIIYGMVMVIGIDSILKPLVISEKSRLNPAMSIIGIIGGLKAFGFMGFVIGPLVLALLFSLFRVYLKDFKPSVPLKEARKKSRGVSFEGEKG
jgi:predicted PurR-regulated permease PerM